ncbi:MAG: hypothetical protein ACPG5O_10055 [Pseudoalteromonas tetraodonis]
MARTGTYSFEDLLANRFQSPRAFGLDNIQPVLDAELAAHDALVASMISELATPTTEAQEVYGSAVGGDMLEVDEYGDAPTQKASPGSTVAYPLKKFQHNLGWTEEFMLKGTVADMAIKTRNAQIAHKKAIVRDMKRAIYGSSNYAFIDSLGVPKGVSLTVRRFLNADGEPIPAGPNGEEYDGSTVTHYTAESTLSNAGLTASIRNVVLKGNGAMVRTAINLANEAAVRGLSGFIPYVDSRLTLNGSANNPVARTAGNRPDNRPIGILDATEVWVKPWAVAGYAFTYDAGASDKPLKMRQESIPSLQGLRPTSPDESGLKAHPLYAQLMEARFGFGVYNRTAGALHEFGVDTTYTDPVIN